eukprot:SAG31_NODE_6154_length_2146_cov_1.617000_2_plen_144_part_00
MQLYLRTLDPPFAFADTGGRNHASSTLKKQHMSDPPSDEQSIVLHSIEEDELVPCSGASASFMPAEHPTVVHGTVVSHDASVLGTSEQNFRTVVDEDEDQVLYAVQAEEDSQPKPYDTPTLRAAVAGYSIYVAIFGVPRRLFA